MKRQPTAAPGRSSTARSGASSSTSDRKVAKAFGLDGEGWMRHANASQTAPDPRSRRARAAP